jgi:sugar lactone lactonase YvrE
MRCVSAGISRIGVCVVFLCRRAAVGAATCCFAGLLMLWLPHGALSEQEVPARLQVSRLLVTLPDSCPTPDGMAIDGEGNLVVSCPNYADPSKPPCFLKITPDLEVKKWFTMPVFAETGRAAPMGFAFGPDGDLYVADNQNWPTGNGERGEINQGRLLRLRVRNGNVEKLTVVAHSISHPNGVRVRDGHVYVTVSMLPKVRREDGLLVSAVYRFGLDDQNVAVRNTLEDEKLLATFVTTNRDCQYGADGLDFDSQGNLLVGNFGDGALHKVTFDAQGRVSSNTIFAKTDFDTPMTDPQFREKMVRAKMRTVDGIWIDQHDHIYVADFSNNAVCRVDPQGRITVLAQSPDTDGADGGLDQPGEVIVWNNRLVATCFDTVVGEDKVNTGNDAPHTIAYIPLD